jgi:hypothetical protein
MEMNRTCFVQRAVKRADPVRPRYWTALHVVQWLELVFDFLGERFSGCSKK